MHQFVLPKRLQDRFFVDGSEHRAGFIDFQRKIPILVSLIFFAISRRRAMSSVSFLSCSAFKASSFFSALGVAGLRQLIGEKEIPRVTVVHFFHVEFFRDIPHIFRKIIFNFQLDPSRDELYFISDCNTWIALSSWGSCLFAVSVAVSGTS